MDIEVSRDLVDWAKSLQRLQGCLCLQFSRVSSSHRFSFQLLLKVSPQLIKDPIQFLGSTIGKVSFLCVLCNDLS